MIELKRDKENHKWILEIEESEVQESLAEAVGSAEILERLSAQPVMIGDSFTISIADEDGPNPKAGEVIRKISETSDGHVFLCYEVDLDKLIRHWASGNWLVSDYEELVLMVKSLERTLKFLKEYKKSWEK